MPSFGPRSLSRRTLLKSLVGGTLAQIALPTLEAMLDSKGLAYAQEQVPIPTRYGVWFWGNGIRRQHWIPRDEGLNWTPPEELQPLIRHQADFNLITGLEVQTATHPHHSGMTGILTGAPYHQVGTTRDTIVSTFASQSVDQIAADTLGNNTLFRSLEVAVCRFRGTDEGTTFQYLSHNGPNNVNPSEYSPQNVFNRLFGMEQNDRVLQNARRSILDGISDDLRRLKTKVSLSDRIRIDQHLEGIRSLEMRLQAQPLECIRPNPITDPLDEGQEPIAEKNALMSELVALSLACDLTRVFSVMFSTAGSGVVIWQAGAQNSLHQICHDEPVPQPIVHQAVIFQMEQLSVFLDHLKSHPEGDGTLLDHCSILCTSELSEGNRHSNDEFPILLAGRGGGRLKTGHHIRYSQPTNASRAVLTSLWGAGLSLDSFGAEGGRTTQGIEALLN